jgi:hypothetical protein
LVLRDQDPRPCQNGLSVFALPGYKS